MPQFEIIHSLTPYEYIGYRPIETSTGISPTGIIIVNIPDEDIYNYHVTYNTAAEAWELDWHYDSSGNLKTGLNVPSGLPLTPTGIFLTHELMRNCDYFYDRWPYNEDHLLAENSKMFLELFFTAENDSNGTYYDKKLITKKDKDFFGDEYIRGGTLLQKGRILVKKLYRNNNKTFIRLNEVEIIEQPMTYPRPFDFLSQKVGYYIGNSSLQYGELMNYPCDYYEDIDYYPRLNIGAGWNSTSMQIWVNSTTSYSSSGYQVIDSGVYGSIHSYNGTMDLHIYGLEFDTRDPQSFFNFRNLRKVTRDSPIYIPLTKHVRYLHNNSISGWGTSCYLVGNIKYILITTALPLDAFYYNSGRHYGTYPYDIYCQIFNLDSFNLIYGDFVEMSANNIENKIKAEPLFFNNQSYERYDVSSLKIFFCDYTCVGWESNTSEHTQFSLFSNPYYANNNNNESTDGFKAIFNILSTNSTSLSGTPINRYYFDLTRSKTVNGSIHGHLNFDSMPYKILAVIGFIQRTYISQNTYKDDNNNTVLDLRGKWQAFFLGFLMIDHLVYVLPITPSNTNYLNPPPSEIIEYYPYTIVNQRILENTAGGGHLLIATDVGTPSYFYQQNSDTCYEVSNNWSPVVPNWFDSATITSSDNETVRRYSFLHETDIDPFAYTYL